jgi:hypothetical protein
MNSIWCSLAAVAVSLLYCFWRSHQVLLARKQQHLRERVAYMLWVMAESVDQSERFLHAQ